MVQVSSEVFSIRRHAMSEAFNEREARHRFSELLGRAFHRGERFLVERRGKPIAAIVSAEELARLEEVDAARPGKGLLAAVGALAKVEGLDEILAEIQRQRTQASEREVPHESH
jgi:prevent-host-death family protein